MNRARLPALVFAVAVTVGLAAPAVAAQAAATDPAPRLAELLDQVLAGHFPLSEVRVEVVGSGLPAWRSLTVFGRGVGIWNGERQFTLPEKQVRALLELLKAQEFCQMPERFGGALAPVSKPGPAAVEVTRAVTLRLGDLSKQVAQVNRGEQSARFEALVRGLYAACQEPASKGLAASDVADGLSKLAAGKLAPETLVLSVHCPQMHGAAGAEGEGWQAVVRGLDLEARSHSLKTGHSRPARMRLGEDGFARLIGALIQEDLAHMPPNLPLEGYTDLTVSVLSHKHSVQARLFAGKPLEGGLRARDGFLRVRQALLELYRRAMAQTPKPGEDSP